MSIKRRLVQLFLIFCALVPVVAHPPTFAQEEDDDSDEEEGGFVPDYSDYAPPEAPPPPPPTGGPPDGSVPPPLPSDHSSPRYPRGSGGTFAGDEGDNSKVRFRLVPPEREGIRKRPWPNRKKRKEQQP